MNENLKKFTEAGFWKTVKKHAKELGSEALGKVFTLYFVLIDGDTPVKAKSIVAGALAYLISPMDAVPDFLPVVGFSDDMALIGVALIAVAASIKPEHSKKAKEVLKNLLA